MRYNASFTWYTYVPSFSPFHITIGRTRVAAARTTVVKNVTCHEVLQLFHTNNHFTTSLSIHVAVTYLPPDDLSPRSSLINTSYEVEFSTLLKNLTSVLDILKLSEGKFYGQANIHTIK